MNVALQGSLFDTGTDSTDDTGAAGTPAVRQLDGLRRTDLGDGAWVDVLPGWVTGAHALFDVLAAEVPWRAERRRMYDRTVDVPRLLSFYDEHHPLPHPVLTTARDRLSRHYEAELGEPFRTAGLCFYRNGNDSVAWHGDTIGRGKAEDTMVAILSVGEARPLLLRPRGGGPTVRYGLGHGDLIVMGGSCQRTWEHAIPKSSQAVGPRISIQFRPRGVL
ncbi:DNA repair protein [Saccharomonospora sp. CUA-673]|uniref:alpha-ketoglutarate-dependent dioxygenase AlkB n=1 Tax=Saccharomonospora sp. CUA-673 TaxID=1904969 RepID=UPI00095CF070|nr:alpha-ketoglutarate-dependent dioxygenase AlkB [Saccharomonospora sp. CUA-673]OLT49029.1 DNA repair protein [Saccharomonospora sp. CUA-673]